MLTFHITSLEFTEILQFLKLDTFIKIIELFLLQAKEMHKIEPILIISVSIFVSVVFLTHPFEDSMFLILIWMHIR